MRAGLRLPLRRAAAIALLGIAMAGCTGESDSLEADTVTRDQRITITARLFYRERIALLSDALAFGVLEADSGEVVNETRTALADR